MPRVPVPAGNTIELRPMGAERFRAASDGGGALAGLGEGLQKLGQAGSQFANTQDAINAELDEAGAKQQLVAYSGFRNEQLYTGDSAFKNLKGQNALNARGAVEKSLDMKIGELEKGLTTTRAKTLFRNAITLERQRDGVEIGTHAVTQARAYNDEQDTALQAQAGQDFIGATLRGDTVAAATARATLTTSIANQYGRNGLAGEPAAQATRRIISGVHASVVDAKTRADPVAAAAYLVAHEAELLPTDRTKLADSLYSPLLERQAAAIVDSYPSAVANAPAVTPALPAAAGSGSLATRMVAITAQTESGNRDYAGGRIITSSAGAQAAMQTMPATQRDPGYGVRPVQDDSVAEKNRVGRDYLAAMMREYGGDTAKAWAAYNGGPGRVDKAVAKHGAAWLQHMPAETQAYVRKNTALLGGDALPAYEPRRDDLEGIYAYIEKQNLPYDLEKAAMAEADRRVARSDRIIARREDDARGAAYGVADRLGDSFTSINQLPPEVVRNLSPEARHSFTEQARQNAKPKEIAANGERIINLHQLAQLDPAAFKRLDLRVSKPFVTAAEYDQISTLQASMLAKAASPIEVAHGRLWGQINFLGRDIGVDMSVRQKGESEAKFKERRADGMALFTVMNNFLRTLTNGERQPTDEEIKRAFDNAVMPRANAEGVVRPRYRDTTLPQNSVAVPRSAHDSIKARLRARGLPSDDQTIARIYIQGK